MLALEDALREVREDAHRLLLPAPHEVVQRHVVPGAGQRGDAVDGDQEGVLAQRRRGFPGEPVHRLHQPRGALLAQEAREARGGRQRGRAAGRRGGHDAVEPRRARHRLGNRRERRRRAAAAAAAAGALAGAGAEPAGRVGAVRRLGPEPRGGRAHHEPHGARAAPRRRGHASLPAGPRRCGDAGAGAGAGADVAEHPLRLRLLLGAECEVEALVEAEVPRQARGDGRRRVRVRGLGRRGRRARRAAVAEDALERPRARLGERRVGAFARLRLAPQAPDDDFSLEVLERRAERGELRLGARGEAGEDVHGPAPGLRVRRARAGGDGDHVGDVGAQRAPRRVDEQKRLHRHQRVVQREEVRELGQNAVLGGEEQAPAEPRDVCAAREVRGVQVHVREELVLLCGDAREREGRSEFGNGQRRLQRVEAGVVRVADAFAGRRGRLGINGGINSGAIGGRGLFPLVEPLRELGDAGAHENAQRAEKRDAVHVEDA